MRITILPAIFLFLILTGTPVLGCICHPSPPPRKQLENADAVFSGTVIKIIRITHEGRYRGSHYEVKFKVDTSWKGINDSVAIVTTEFWGCGYGFEEGKRYLVYAFGKTELSVSMCSRTKPLREASKDIKELGTPLEQRPDKRIHRSAQVSLIGITEIRRASADARRWTAN